jgi:EmrB/QacA subfamily drug resistance transporter
MAVETIAAPVPNPVAAPAERPSWGALFVVLAGTFVTMLDLFIVNVAIPSMQHDLHATAATIQFVVAGYGLAFAAGLITAGRLGDLFGRRRMYAIGLALFTLASAAAGLAPSAGALVGARVAQGLAAALLTPQVLAVLNTVYTGRQRAAAYNAYGLAMGLGGVFGQLIGGALIQADPAGLGWRAIFLINVPVGVVAVALTFRLVPESRASGRARLDLAGAVLVSAGLVAVVLPLIEGRQQGWPLWTWLCLAAAPVLLAGFAGTQYRLGRARALVDLALFRERAFSVGLVIFLCYTVTAGSFFLVLSLYLQIGHGLSALGSGLLILPLGAGFFLASARAAQLAARWGRQVVAAGAVTLAAGDGLLALAVHGIGVTGSVLWTVPALLVIGTGMGLVMTPLSPTILAGVAPEHAAAASGVLATVQEVGGALGIALIGNVFFDALGTPPRPAAFAPALDLSLVVLAGCVSAVAALVQLLPRHR